MDETVSMNESRQPPAVDFYIVEHGTDEEVRRVACRLAEKGWRKGYPVVLRAADAGEAQALDDLLWTFRQESFVPHGLAVDDPGAPVVITHGDLPQDPTCLLINLGHDIAARAGGCRRIAEIVGATDAAKDAGRQRYRTYRERGWPLRTYPVTS